MTTTVADSADLCSGLLNSVISLATYCTPVHTAIRGFYMTQTKFTERLREAVIKLDDGKIGLISCRSRSLFSPVFRNRKYQWAKLMDCDGLLVTRRLVHDGEGGSPLDEVSLLMGVVIQCEDTTSQSKPNPFGKASLPHVPNGVWVDVSKKQSQSANGGRLRLDRVLILFVLPKGAAPTQRKKFETAKRNVENAAILMPDAETLEVARNTSAANLCKHVGKIVRPFLKGAGRPKRAQ